MIVCATDCEAPQNVVPARQGADFSVEGRGSIVRQATVYYWINRLYDRMAEIGYAPGRPGGDLDLLVPGLARGRDDLDAALDPLRPRGQEDPDRL